MAPSKRIAVAGGKGGLGRNIVEGLLEQHHALDSVIVLSRTASPSESIEYQGHRARVVAVNYDDISNIESVLREHRIDTLISVIFAAPDQIRDMQINMIKASLNVPSMRRFAPSEFGASSENAVSITEYYASRREVLKFLREAKTAGKGLEWTNFSCGVFMNYLGYENPRPSPEKEKAYGYVRPMVSTLYFNLSEGRAILPEKGEDKQWWTRVEDIGRFVAAAVQFDTWPELSTMAGSLATGSEIVTTFERISGRKLDVTYWPKEEILQQIEKINSLKEYSPVERMLEKAFRESQLSIINGELPSQMILNELADVKPMGLEEYLQLWWSR
ncbi:hypothetical protein VKT23_015781 [Stygiomarasmius scandens]|uniref:NmrA-like domain-containing protein n=1 Tax=Marasmiellus scandens TaxID=2682957 RepID=A0ABR1IZV4_9AGAR